MTSTSSSYAVALLMDFQNIPLPPTSFQEATEPLRPLRLCSCNCTSACKCACSCRDHCVCQVTQCEGDCAEHVSRNLVVFLDELSKDFGWQNATVVKLHSRILTDPDHRQLTYYDCAIDTHTSRPTGSIRYLLRCVGNAVGQVAGWNLKKAILKAYLWLCEHYEPGDKIFLFGFSRGAYQAQILAAMVETVGLVHAGNFRLVPSIYDVFLDTRNGQADAIQEAQRFKKTFARNIKVHFVGAWDTVSYPGIGRKSGPILPSSEEHVCLFRHALALDECRVKLLPVYTFPSQSVRTMEKVPVDADKSRDRVPHRTYPGLFRTVEEEQLSKVETDIKNLKEVWFAGNHADMGGGSNSDTEPCSISLLWMENEATSAGLRLRSRKFWDECPREEATDKPKQELKDLFPKKSSRDNSCTTRTSHIRDRRLISRGQCIHVSVALMDKGYRPPTSHGATDWETFVGQDLARRDFAWASKYADLLETDLFSPPLIMDAVQSLNDIWKEDEHSDREPFWIERLSLMALSRNLCAAYLSSATPIWDEDCEMELACALKFFQRLAEKKPDIFNGDVAEIMEAQGRLFHLRGQGDPGALFEAALCLRRACAADDRCSGTKYKLAASLTRLGSYAVGTPKAQNALRLFDEAVEITGLLLAEEYPAAFPLFALLQQNFTTCLRTLSHHSDIDSATRVAETIITLSRALARSYPQYSSVLAAALHARAFGFPRNHLSRETDAAVESITLYRNLAEQNSNVYGLVLADALSNFAGQLFAIGQYERALTACLEEVQIRRKSRDKDCLATCVTQLSRILNVMGRADGALNTAEKAVRIRRTLVDKEISWQLEARLADSLNNLSCCLALDPRSAEHALNAAREATSIQRGLARDMPAGAFNSRLCILLHNLSVGLSEVGRHEEALRAAEEVLRLRTGRGNDCDRARALSRVALCLRAVGKQDEAMRMAESCLDLTDGLMLKVSTHNLELQRIEQLAETLFNISFCLAAERAVQTARDSVAFYRNLTKSNSTLLNTAFARASLQLSRVLLSAEQPEEALSVAAEAAQIEAGLSKDCYATCLYHLSLCLHAAGKPEQGTNPAHHCVELRRELVDEYGIWQFKEKLANALFNLSLYLPPESPKGLEVVREAVGMVREGAAHIPAWSDNQCLRDGLQSLAARAILVGQTDEALRCAEEALGLARKLIDIGASPSLVNVLYTHANVLCKQARYEQAHSASLEADALRAGVPPESIFASSEADAAYLSTRARCLVGLARHDDGLHSLLNAVNRYKEAIETAPSKATFESFPWFLRNVFACVSTLVENGSKVCEVIGKMVKLCHILAEISPGRFENYLKQSLELRARCMCPAGQDG
ncbi:hypothetical protein C8R47DRAFT_1148529 [Mycena vitilis]|nr:hypothetical protein C8R47DRAFT_1148529 [Mycena vitilis]